MRMRTLTAALMIALGLLGGVAVLAQRPEGRSKKTGPPPPVPVSTPPAEELPLPQAPPIEPGPPPAVGEPPPPSQIPMPPPLEPPPPAAARPPLDDPMQDVDAFVEQNRKKAEDSIQRLTKEAETLRARLRKVEMALERWKSLAGALDRPQQGELESAPAEHAPELIPAPTLPRNQTDE